MAIFGKYISRNILKLETQKPKTVAAKKHFKNTSKIHHKNTSNTLQKTLQKHIKTFQKHIKTLHTHFKNISNTLQKHIKTHIKNTSKHINKYLSGALAPGRDTAQATFYIFEGI